MKRLKHKYKLMICIMLCLSFVSMSITIQAETWYTNIAGAQGHYVVSVADDIYNEGIESYVLVYSTPGADTSTYTVVEADKGKTLSCLAVSSTQMSGYLSDEVLVTTYDIKASDMEGKYRIDGHTYENNGIYWFGEGGNAIVTPGNGFTISTSENGPFYSASIALSQADDKRVYFCREYDGAISEAVDLAGVIKYDVEAPTGEIKIDGENSWNNFTKLVMSEVFYKENVSVAISAHDASGSGVNKVECYISYEDLICDDGLTDVQAVNELEAAIDGAWKVYTDKVELTENSDNIVYAKITDNVGNVSYICTQRIVLDNTPPVLLGIEDGETYYADKVFKALDDRHYQIKLEIDGVDVTDQTKGDDEYTVAVDNKEHGIKITDKAGNATEYTIGMYKMYTITFVDGDTVLSTINEKHGDRVTMPEPPAKEGYTAKWDTIIEKATGDTTVKVVYTKLEAGDSEDNTAGTTSTENADNTKDGEGEKEPLNSPQTGDDGLGYIWFGLLVISGSGIYIIPKNKRKYSR